MSRPNQTMALAGGAAALLGGVIYFRRRQTTSGKSGAIANDASRPPSDGNGSGSNNAGLSAISSVRKDGPASKSSSDAENPRTQTVAPSNAPSEQVITKKGHWTSGRGSAGPQENDRRT